MQWTERQQEAIQARDADLLLVAAAGSGKTAVLVERICALARENVGIESMLVVTFTRAAAAEMREKILKAFQKEADAGGENGARFAEQAALVENAQISTLHGFCAALLRTHFGAVGVDPLFRIAEEKEGQALLEEALTETVTARYAEQDADFDALALRWSDAQIIDMVQALYHFTRTQPHPEDWLAQALAAYAQDEAALDDSPWTRALAAAARGVLHTAQASLLQAQRLCSLPGGPARYLDAIQSDLQAVAHLLRAVQQGYSALQAEVQAYQPMRLATADKQADPALVEQAKKLRGDAKDAVRERLGKRLYALPLSVHAQDLREQACELRALAQTVRQVEARYAARKSEHNLLDYEDLEHKALEAVALPWVAETLRARYAAIFVDEYQDSSVMQETLVQAIARPRSVFLVGDVKQSIYRFRQAAPQLFLDKAETFAYGEGAAHRRVDLNRNFRSRANILAAVNRVFAYAMRREETEIAYDEDMRLYPGLSAQGEDPPVELHLLEEDGAAAPEADAEGTGGAGRQDPLAWAEEALPDDAVAREARVAARRIAALVDTPVWDARQGGFRPLRFRDVAILLRVSRGVAQRVQRALEQEGIPVYSDTGDAYFALPEVRMVMDLLTVVDNPLHDDALLGALRGPAARLSNEALAHIRAAHPEGGYAEAVQAFAQGESALAHRLRAFHARLAAWRLLSRAQPLEQLVWHLCEETGCYARAGTLPGGRARQANLRMLAERAAAFGRTRGGGLSAFLWEAQQLRARGDTDSAKALGEGENVVRIMTMHKSKGLEFPVVICMELGRDFLRKPAGTPIKCHAALGLALPFTDCRLHARYSTLACEALRMQTRREALADASRLLYVAMTRAQERLILIGHGGGRARALDDRLARWAADAQGALLSEAATLLDFVLPTVLTHPDGAPLRQAGTDCALTPDASRWQVVRHARTPEAAVQADAPRDVAGQLAAWARTQDVDEALLRETARTLGWQPPAIDPAAPAQKTSVTALLRAQEGEDAPRELARQPQFITGEHAPDAAARGTAFHAAMRGLELARLRGLTGQALCDEVTAQLDAMVSAHHLSPTQRAQVRAADIAAFFAQPLGARMLHSGLVRREWPFNLRQEEAGRTRLVQGVIDCCYREPEGWILLDYKTDADPDTEAVLARHAFQVNLYAQALARITGVPVAARALYLTKQGTILPYMD